MPLSPTLLYLLKANGALLLFALAYFGLLRRLTFFTLNRVYLVFALLFSAVCPALPVPALLPPLETPIVVKAARLLPQPSAGAETALAESTATAAAPAPIDWKAVVLAVYAAGAAVGLLRLLVQLLSLWRLRRTSRPVVLGGVAVRALPGEVSPFSFGSTIYLNPARHPAAELATVLRHEQVHVRQWHTLDVLLAQLAQAAAWCNPAAWLLRRALLDNLEYLADHAVLEAGLDRRAYQYSLLRLSQGAAGPALVSHFTFLTLKNRVAMMNTSASATAQLLRYLLIIPLGLVLTVGKTSAQRPARPAPAAQAAPSDQVFYSDYYVDGKHSNEATFDKVLAKTSAVSYLNFLEEDEARQVLGPKSGRVAIIVTERNENSPEVRALNAKIMPVARYIPGSVVPSNVSALAPAALVYIGKTYPNARIAHVTRLRVGTTQQSHYRVKLTESTGPRYAYFDEKGNSLKQ
jgi:hypothetical protein